MPPIPSTTATGTPAASPLQGLLGILQARQPDEGALFQREVDRAVERQGGEAAVEARTASLEHDRRASRRGEFERYRERAGATNRRAPEDEEGAETRAPAVPVAAQARPTSDAPEPAAERGTSRQSSSSDSGSGGRSATNSEAATALPSNPGKNGAATPGRVSGTGGATGAQAVTAASAAGSARPAGPSAAFVAGARSGAANSPTNGPTNGTGTAAPAAPATPDVELIEHANEVLRQIRMRLQAGGREVSLQLSPAELGRLSIRMRMQDGKLSTLVRVESPETLELLERQTPELRALLAQQGIESERLDIELGFSGGYENLERQGSGRPAKSGASETNSADHEVGGEENDHVTSVLTGEDGVDTYA